MSTLEKTLLTLQIKFNRTEITVPYSKELDSFLKRIVQGNDDNDIKILKRYFNVPVPDGEFYISYKVFAG